MCFFIRDKGVNSIVMAVSDGKFILDKLPEPIERKFKRAGIEDAFYCQILEDELKKSNKEDSVA